MGFGAPYGLLGLSFLGLLLWIYFRERRQRDLEVPSLLLWQTMRDDVDRSRFRPDALFFVRAAILAVLALALARPFTAALRRGPAEGRTIFVFDTSASMQAVEQGERRFDRARRKAAALLAGLDRDVEIMVVAVDARPRVVAAFTRDRGAVEQALEAIEPRDGPTRLGVAIQFARAAAGGAAGALEIDVFTDVPRDQVPIAALGAGERLRYFRFGRSDDNVAIAALRVYQSPFQDETEAHGYALLKNYSSRERDVALHATLDGRTLVDERIHLGPHESRSVPVEPLRGSGRLQAWIDAHDALALDDRAIADVAKPRKIRVLAVTANVDVANDLREVARAVPALDLRSIEPAAYRPRDGSAADVAVFHGFVPEPAPATNALYVYPPLRNSLFPGQRDVLGAQILDWNDRDPVLRDLRYVEALPLDRSRLIALPAWAHVLIASRADAREFPLAFSGELSGRRIVCFAFDSADRSVRKSENLTLLLLTLNALRWLVPPDPSAALQVDVGETWRESEPEPRAIVLRYPDGSVEARPAALEVEVEVSRVGVYEVKIGSSTRMLYANLFDGEESDIGRPDGPAEETLVGSPGRESSADAPDQRREWTQRLLVLGILLLALEWLYAEWRRRAHGS